MLTDIFQEVLLSGLVDGKGEEDKREPASLMKQESKDGVQYNPLDAGALVEGGKVIGQNSFKMAGQVTSKQLDNVDEDGPKKSTFIKVKEPKEFSLLFRCFRLFSLPFIIVSQVIIGVSAAFLVWDAIDLGFTISDLVISINQWPNLHVLHIIWLQVRKKGSQSAKVLRDKATMLRVALEETAAEFCLDMPE